MKNKGVKILACSYAAICFMVVIALFPCYDYCVTVKPEWMREGTLATMLFLAGTFCTITGYGGVVLAFIAND